MDTYDSNPANWVTIPLKNLGEAIDRAVATTGNWNVTLGGDCGQDGDDDAGMSNDDFTILVWANGTAMLTVRVSDNERYLKAGK